MFSGIFSNAYSLNVDRRLCQLRWNVDGRIFVYMGIGDEILWGVEMETKF